MDARSKTTEQGGTAVAAPRRPGRGQRPSTRSTTVMVTAISLAAAGVLTGGLAAQMAAGDDPALGVKEEAPPTGQSADPAVAAQSPPSAATGTAQPAPAPAPVVTRTS